MASLRTSIISAVAALMSILLLMAPAFAQPCAPRWDLEFAASGADWAIRDFEVFDDGTGPALYAAGGFSEIQGKRAWGIAKWDGRDWSEVGGGLRTIWRLGAAYSLHVWDDGRGPALYVGGSFTHAGNVIAINAARWDGRNWEALGAGTSRVIYAFATFDDGRGEALYAGGLFTEAGGSPAFRIARWDGAGWEPLGQGLDWGRVRWGVRTMAVFDDGSGPMLYVGGDIDYVIGEQSQAVPAYLLARWDGQRWSPVPDAMLSGRGNDAHVDQLLVHDDGNGPALFVAGQFAREGTGEYLLRWDGREWTALGGGIRSVEHKHGDAMCVYDDGSGPVLWIGGGEVWINDLGRTSSMYRWDGTTLSAPATFPVEWIDTLGVFNDGFGPALYLGGDIRIIAGEGGGWINHIVRWSQPHMALSHSPLRAGERAVFATSCSTPGQRVNFLYSARGLGSVFIPQLGITIDLDRPQFIGHSIADPGGKAGLSRAIPPDVSGRTLWLQAAEVGRKTEVVESVIE